MGAVSHVMSAHKIAFARAEEQRAGVGVVTHSSSESTHANEYHHDRRQGRSARRACGRSPSTPLAHSDSIAPQIGGFWTSGWGFSLALSFRSVLLQLIASLRAISAPSRARFASLLPLSVTMRDLALSRPAGPERNGLLQRQFRQSVCLVPKIL